MFWVIENLQFQYPNWLDYFAEAYNLAQSGFRLPRQNRERPGENPGLSQFVRPGVIETPTGAWQAPVIPLNHGRLYEIITIIYP